MKKIKKYFFRDMPSTMGTLISALVVLFMVTGPFIARYKPLIVDMGAKSSRAQSCSLVWHG